jgi:signal transduction histidine kinase
LRPLVDPRLWLFSLVFWSVLGLFDAASEVIDAIDHGSRHSLWEPVVWEMTSSFAFALLFPAIVALALARRLTGPPRTAIPALGWHLLAMLVVSAAHVGLMVGARKLIYYLVGRSYDFGNLGLQLPYELCKDIITYWILVGLILGFDYYRRYQFHQQETIRLQQQLTAARLEALQHRLQPHFLFNALNTISATMHRDVAAADTMIARLSDLLRLSLDRSEAQLIPLRQELELLNAYFDIMRARLGPSLQIKTHIDPEVLDTPVPPLILQPLAENAIKHGIAGRTRGGCLEVTVTAHEGICVLRVRDDGPGVADTQQVWGQGLGLTKTAERLRTLFGERHQLQAANGDDGGFVVTIEVPLESIGGTDGAL